jgi:hypothetical protein
MKWGKRRIDDGITPVNYAITNEIAKNKRAVPKTFVPVKRLTMGDPNPRKSVNWGGSHKRKSPKITLAKSAT